MSNWDNASLIGKAVMIAEPLWLMAKDFMLLVVFYKVCETSDIIKNKK